MDKCNHEITVKLEKAGFRVCLGCNKININGYWETNEVGPVLRRRITKKRVQRRATTAVDLRSKIRLFFSRG